MQKELKNKNSEQSRIKKIFRFTASRFLFLVIGISLSIAVVSVYAAWNTKVNTGDPLTEDLWNDVVDKLIELDNRATAIENGGTVSSLYTCTKSNGESTKTCGIGTHDVCFMAGVDTWEDDNNNYDGCFINGTQGGNWTIDIDCASEDQYICGARCLDL